MTDTVEKEPVTETKELSRGQLWLGGMGLVLTALTALNTYWLAGLSNDIEIEKNELASVELAINSTKLMASDDERTVTLVNAIFKTAESHFSKKDESKLFSGLAKAMTAATALSPKEQDFIEVKADDAVEEANSSKKRSGGFYAILHAYRPQSAQIAKDQFCRSAKRWADSGKTVVLLQRTSNDYWGIGLKTPQLDDEILAEAKRFGESNTTYFSREDKWKPLAQSCDN